MALSLPPSAPERPAARGNGATTERVDPRDTMLLTFIAAVLLFAFAAFTLAFEPGGSHSINHAATRLVRAFHDAGLAGAPLNRIEWYGSPAPSLLLVFILALGLAVRGRFLVASLAIAALAGLTAIEGILRVRIEAVPWGDLPQIFLHPRGHHLMDSSYPSGHVARLLLLLGMVTALLPARIRLPAALLSLAAGLAIGVQRIQVGAHSGSDVVGGLLLGGGLAAAFAATLPAAGHVERRLREWLTGVDSAAPSTPGT